MNETSCVQEQGIPRHVRKHAGVWHLDPLAAPPGYTA